jgi:hypothetical protein
MGNCDDVALQVFRLLIGPVGSSITLRLRSTVSNSADAASVADDAAAEVEVVVIRQHAADCSSDVACDDNSSVSSGISLASMRSDVIQEETIASSAYQASSLEAAATSTSSSFSSTISGIGMSLLRNRFGQYFVHRLSGASAAAIV